MEIKLDVSNAIIYLVIYDENFFINEFFNFWLREDIFLIIDCNKCTSYFNSILNKLMFFFNTPEYNKILFINFLFKRFYYIELVLLN